jgi:hypothetical protein
VRRHLKTAGFPICLLSAGSIGALAQAIPVAKPVEPIGAILDAFRSHALVALGDPHGNEQVAAFRLALIRDPRFAATVNDIVVEFGNARYQDVVDRFVRGEEVPAAALRRIWQDTTQVEFDWDRPIYEEFFRGVRAVNASLPSARKLRVLLGDTPIDWSTIHSAGDLMKVMETGRDAYAVGVIQKEVLARKRRALIIYGDQHLIRRNVIPNAPQPWARGLVAQLERPGIATLFTVHPETRKDWTAWQADTASWPKPSLTITRDTAIGRALFSEPPQRAVHMEEQFDALLYIGPPSTMTQSRLSPALCADPQYMQMRLARLDLVPPPPGAPMKLGDLLKAECARR